MFKNILLESYLAIWYWPNKRKFKNFQTLASILKEMAAIFVLQVAWFPKLKRDL